MHTDSRRTVRRLVLASGVLSVLLVAQVAWAAVLDDVELTGDEGTIWDAEGDETYGVDGGPCTGVNGGVQGEGFTPAYDGENNFTSDVFDGGLYVVANGKVFGNNIENGPVSGQRVQVGPQMSNHVRIKRTDRALQNSPTLRSLIKFQNPGNRRRTMVVNWDSAMGADGEEETRDSSAAPALVHSTADRWMVTSDDPVNANLSDPPAVFVYSGKGAAEKVEDVIYSPEDPDPANGIGEACIVVRFKFRVPANSTRYLLLFTEMGLDNGDARAQAGKYNDRNLNGNLLEDLKGSVKRKTVNWDLN